MLLHGTSAWASLPSLVNIASPSALSKRRKKNKKIRKAQQTVSHFFPHNCEKVKKEKQEDLFFFGDCGQIQTTAVITKETTYGMVIP